MTRLADIVAAKRVEASELSRRIPTDSLRAQARSSGEVRGFARALRKVRRSIIAELKRSSPSAGVISADYDIQAIAREYEAGGATAISVLTDREFFRGDAMHLRQARSAVGLPILRKDFILDEAQIYESRIMGADAVLLIVRLLSQDELEKLYALATELGMDVLVEVHTADEVARANAIGAGIVGVNNRDLDTFAVSLSTGVALRPLVRSGAIVVAESGVKGPEDARTLWDAGCDALLVGESLMMTSNRASAIAGLREA